MTLALWLKVLSLFLSIWAIRYYWKIQPPLDRLAGLVRLVGIVLCVAFWLLEFGVVRSMPHGKLWIHNHILLTVVMAGLPSFLGGAFLLLPGFSRGIAEYLRQRVADRRDHRTPDS